MNCPVCNVALQMTDRQGIEIDYCPQCRGVWLDRGELDKLIERSASRETDRDEARAGMDRGRYDDRDRREDRGRHGNDDAYRNRKKKSLWREIFDFD